MQILGQHFTVLDTIDSTNNYAMQKIEQESAQHGHAWLAKYQTDGKGQRNKQWYSQKGKNILLSIALNINTVSISEQFYLSASMALAARNLFAKYVYNDEKVKVKWPNDIYWGDIKAGGLLIENRIVGQKWQWAIVGFGLNINQEEFDENLSKKAVSLKMIKGTDFDVEKLSKELCEDADKMYSLFSDGNFQKILQEYNHYLYKRGEVVKLKKGNILFEGEIVGVNSSGKLMVKTSMLEEFNFGEIVWEI